MIFTPWILANCHQLNNLITAIFSTSRLLSSNKILFRNSLNEKGKAERLCEVAGQAAAQTPPAELLCLACLPHRAPWGGNLLQVCDTAASKRLSSTPCIMEKVLSYPPPPHYTPIILVLANIPWHNIYLRVSSSFMKTDVNLEIIFLTSQNLSGWHSVKCGQNAITVKQGRWRTLTRRTVSSVIFLLVYAYFKNCINSNLYNNLKATNYLIWLKLKNMSANSLDWAHINSGMQHGVESKWKRAGACLPGHAMEFWVICLLHYTGHMTI